MTTLSALPSLPACLEQLQTDRLSFFPIRHHSPACAWHLQQLIRQTRPAAILIEGPSDATSDIPTLLHPEAQAPFALYSTYRDLSGHLPAQSDDSPQRFAGYYPFCDYSPELVALRSGAEIEAELEFIDLPYPEQVMAARSLQNQGAGPAEAVRLKALQSDRHLNHSAYLNRLACKANCRDFNELWDHLFESQIQRSSTPEFIRTVATYCYFARQDAPVELLAADGTHLREAAMARAIAKTLKRLKNAGNNGQVLVVTGGLHSIALPQLVAQPPRAPAKLKFKKDSAQRFLVRYGFEQLDSLNGYASGMPSPAYYQTLWENLQAQQPDPAWGMSLSQPAHQTAAQLLLQIRSQSQRRQALTSLSIADSIAALEQANRLARLRQHPGPSRDDLLDACRSCFVKGELDGEGAIMMTVVDQSLRGDRIGCLPAHIGVPPIVEDFRRRAKQLRLKIDQGQPKTLTLDLYRQQSHRQASRLLHSLDFLKVPFAKRRGGPDFVQGKQLDRLTETWEYQWQPKTESLLIERSHHGETIAEATLDRLKASTAELSASGEGQSALAAVRLLIQACRLGLQDQTGDLLQLIGQSLASDADFVQLSAALTQLTLLWRSREPLEAYRLVVIPRLRAIAYRRLCYLIPQLAQAPNDGATAPLKALGSLWEQVASPAESGGPGALDRDLLLEGLLTLLDCTDGNALLQGAAAGLLYQAQCLEGEMLVTLVTGYLDGAVSAAGIAPERGVGFLRGLLYLCRELAWTQPSLLAALDQRLGQWSEADFLQLLPELRLTFAEFLPRETDRLAGLVASFHGSGDRWPTRPEVAREAGADGDRSAPEADLQRLGQQVGELVQAALAQAGLEHWLRP